MGRLVPVLQSEARAVPSLDNRALWSSTSECINSGRQRHEKRTEATDGGDWPSATVTDKQNITIASALLYESP
jgi:hypothetical protein